MKTVQQVFLCALLAALTTLSTSAYGFASGTPGDPLTVGATLRANF